MKDMNYLIFTSIPRVSGGEPSQIDAEKRKIQYSPRERG